MDVETKEEKSESMDVEKDEKVKQEVKKDEPNFEILKNPARVTPTQLPLITFDVDPRYLPIVSDYGVVLLKDTKPDEKEELLDANQTVSNEYENEPSPPEPFTFFG